MGPAYAKAMYMWRQTSLNGSRICKDHVYAEANKFEWVPHMQRPCIRGGKQVRMCPAYAKAMYTRGPLEHISPRVCKGHVYVEANKFEWAPHMQRPLFICGGRQVQTHRVYKCSVYAVVQKAKHVKKKIEWSREGLTIKCSTEYVSVCALFEAMAGYPS